MPITIGNGITLGPGVTITPFGVVSNTDGSVQLSGNNYLSVPAGQSGQITNMGVNDFTWECFVYPTINTSYQTFIDTRTQPIGGDTTGFFFGTASGSYAPIVYANSLLLTSTRLLTVNAWNHVALTRSSGTLTIWINGVESGSQSGINMNLSQQRVFIGGSTNSALDTTGYISNVRMVNGIAVYTGAFITPTSRLLSSQGGGTNTSAITSAQTALLLDTTYGDGFLVDSSIYALTVNNNNNVTNSTLKPF
jgi:hypothetical protein